MAVDPEMPFNREEMYLAAAAGEGVEVPPCPWSRKEAYLDQIGGRLDDMDTRIAALATDISFKGGVATEDDLPSGAAVGDAYITEDTGVIYVWVGDSWVALGGTGINVVQTTGTSTTDVMSQDATTNMVFKMNGSTKQGIHILTGNAINGQQSSIIIGNPRSYSYSDVGTTVIGGGSALGSGSIAIGPGLGAYDSANTEERTNSVAIGYQANTGAYNSVAIGACAKTTRVGEMNIGAGTSSNGFSNSSYRVLGGLYDGQDAHDAATVGQLRGETILVTASVQNWTTLQGQSPYTYSNTVAITSPTIGANSIVELINNQPALFAKYGLAIGAVYGQNVTLFSIGMPTADFNFSLNIRG